MALKPFKTMYIYKTTRLSDGLSYIGQRKWHGSGQDHSYLGSGTYLKYAIKKYGKMAFTCEVLEYVQCISTEPRLDLFGEVSDYWLKKFEELDDLEKFYIKKYDTFKNGFNLDVGGGGNPGYKHSEEMR